jgi:hypothetical protein
MVIGQLHSLTKIGSEAFFAAQTSEDEEEVELAVKGN